jgi:hypothetical protein
MKWQKPTGWTRLLTLASLYSSALSEYSGSVSERWRSELRSWVRMWTRSTDPISVLGDTSMHYGERLTHPNRLLYLTMGPVTLVLMVMLTSRLWLSFQPARYPTFDLYGVLVVSHPQPYEYLMQESVFGQVFDARLCHDAPDPNFDVGVIFRQLRYEERYTCKSIAGIHQGYLKRRDSNGQQILWPDIQDGRWRRQAATEEGSGEAATRTAYASSRP